MARKVKETPVLSGKDAERFDRAIKANENKKVSADDYKRAVDNYDRIKKSSGLA